MPKTHELKTWPDCFQAVFEGRKPFEIRLNDRDYRVGDQLLMREYDPERDDYTGRACERAIISLMEGGRFGLQDGYVALGLDTSDSPITASPGMRAIVAERRRQIEVEGWTTEHDDEHTAAELALAASSYTLFSAHRRLTGLINMDLGVIAHKLWPWDKDWFKPKDTRRDLVRAGALIVAELDKLERDSIFIRTRAGQGVL